jgi:Flp pilus assembly protein TadD
MKGLNSINEVHQKSLANNVTQAPHNISGIENADSGEYEDAIREFTKAIGLDPMDEKSYFHRATLKVRLGDLEGARADFKMAENCCHSKINPKYNEYPLL